MRRRCVFFVLPTPASLSMADAVRAWLTPETLSVMRDYAARGHVVVPTVADAIDPREALSLSDAIRDRTGAHVAAVLSLRGSFEPRMVWDLARTHALDLARSVLVTEERRLSGLFHIAGVTRVMTTADAEAIYHAA